MDRRRFLVWSGSAITVPLAGCAGERDDSEDGPDGGENDTDGGDAGDQRTEQPDPVELSGDGDATHDGLEIRGGLTVVEAIHDGSSNFVVELAAADREYGQVFVNQTGGFEGTTAALIDGGTYQVDVDADGRWVLTVRQPRAASGEAMPVSLEETGYVVEGPYEFSGSHTASASKAADGKFIADVLLPADDVRETVFSEFGEFQTESTVRAEGVGWIAVQADGEWRLELE